MKPERDIVRRVEAAKGSARAADLLVRDYLPYITSEAVKFAGRPLARGRDDELSIAMFAFHEAVLSYNDARGAFIPWASRVIRNRLIDFTRRDGRYREVDSLDAPCSNDLADAERPIVEMIADEHDDMAEHMLREATRQEIAEFAAQLEGYGVALADVADSSPRQERTLSACRRVLDFARANPEVLDRFTSSKKLPVSILAKGSGVERKVIERHRRYLVALLLAYTNGFEIIRGHLCVAVRSAGGAAR